MPSLLYLVHRIPYPPNKGDKIRSYNILKFLSQYFDIYCGTFIDTPEDEQYKSKVQSYCKDVFFETINPTTHKIKSLKGFATGDALSIPYYASSSMQQWVDKTIEKHNIKTALAFSSPVAQFIIDKDMHKLMDFIDIDSDKWQQYSDSHQGIMSWIYRREAKKLFKYEQQIAQKFNTSFFVSDKEAGYFKHLLLQQEPQNSDEILGISNGIDFDFFDPTKQYENPYNTNSKKLVFTGAMDYWANVDAVVWFAEEVFKPLYQLDNSYEFIIVGGNPTDEVKNLEQNAGITVTGRVKDVRPYIQYAHMGVAPLRIARGIQNKVLEALAMKKVVISTTNAMEGIQTNETLNSFIEDDPKKQVELILQLSQNENRDEIGKQAGNWIKESYEWASVLKPLKALIESTD